MTTVAITDVPRWTVQVLHSEFIGWLVDLDPVVRDAFIERTGGLSFDRFLLAMLNGRYVVDFSEVDGEESVGLGVPLTSGKCWVLFSVPARRAGVNGDYVRTSLTLDFEAELAELLDEGS